MDILQQISEEKNKPKALPDRIYEELLRDILTGRLRKDSRLNETKICQTYKASRTPVREAFRRLEMDGLVEYIPNRGEFVRGLSQTEVDDMLLMRIELEVLAVQFSVERITEEEEEELADIFKFMEFYTKKNDIQKMIDINFAFHRLLYKSAHDKLLEKTLLAYHTYTNYCCPHNYFAPNYLKRVLAEHRRVYRAIMAKDSHAATDAMRVHMERTVKRSNQALKLVKPAEEEDYII